MKIDRHSITPSGLSLFAAGLLFAGLLFAAPSFARERVAQLSTIEGQVQVLRSNDNSVDEVVQIGTRVRGGSLYSGDEVSTGSASSAVLVFSDGTSVELDGDTVVAVRQSDESKRMAQGKVDKPIGRTIQLIAGGIFSDIAHNDSVATRFETPSGVAAVKGTRIRLSIAPEEASEVQSE